MKQLINEDGNIHFGAFDEPVDNINYLDFPLENVMDKRISLWRRKKMFNQFHFIGLMNEEFMAGLAIVDLKWLSNCFFYLYDIKSGQLFEKSIIMPLALNTAVDTTPNQGCSIFQNLGVHACIEQSSGNTQVKYQSKQATLDVQLKQSNGYQPLRVCSQAGYNGWVFTQKTAGLAVSGSIRVLGKDYKLSEATSFGSVDWSCGFMRRETAWNWAAISGPVSIGGTDKHTAFGLNLASGVNETGITENGFWLDGQLHKLGPVRFIFNRKNPEADWHIMSDCGRVKLTFNPLGKRVEKVNAGLIASNFKQVFGYYSGYLLTANGKRVDLDAVPGFAEDHYAKW